MGQWRTLFALVPVKRGMGPKTKSLVSPLHGDFAKISSSLLQNFYMGISNYVKSRLKSANRKFRADPFYVFFLLLVKEKVELIRSEQTYFRKATKNSNLSAQNLKNISKELLIRYDNAFTQFKSMRGTSSYFQDVN